MFEHFTTHQLSDTTILHAVSTLTGHAPSKYISVCHSMSTIPRSPRSTGSINKVALYFPNETSQTRAHRSQYMYRTAIEPSGVRPDMQIQNTHVKCKALEAIKQDGTGQRDLQADVITDCRLVTFEKHCGTCTICWSCNDFTTLWPLMGTFCCICPVCMLPHPTVLSACKTKF